MVEKKPKTIGGNQRMQTILWEKLRDILRSTGEIEKLKIEIVPDPLDQVISSAERELAVAQLEGHARLIQDIRSALLKIKDGTYGNCEECDEPIAARRLDVLPWARYCIRCQQQVESRLAEGGESDDEATSFVRAGSMPPSAQHPAGKEWSPPLDL